MVGRATRPFCKTLRAETTSLTRWTRNSDFDWPPTRRLFRVHRVRRPSRVPIGWPDNASILKDVSSRTTSLSRWTQKLFFIASLHHLFLCVPIRFQVDWRAFDQCDVSTGQRVGQVPRFFFSFGFFFFFSLHFFSSAGEESGRVVAGRRDPSAFAARLRRQLLPR